MKLKKLLALGLAVVMTASTLAACGNKDEGKSSQASSSEQESSQPSSSAATPSSSQDSSAQPSSTVAPEDDKITFPLKETLEVSVLGFTVAPDFGLEKNPVLNKYLEEANIKFDYVMQVTASDAKEKGNLLMAGGEYPEILYKMSSLSAYQYGQDGLVLPLEDIIKEHMPNLCKILDARGGWQTMTSPDGHIWSLPQVSQPTPMGNDAMFFINDLWLKNLNLTAPTNYEELYDVLKAFKEKDANGNGDPNDEIPLFMRSGLLPLFINWFGTGDGALHYAGNNIALKDGELVFYPFEEGYKEFVSFFAKLYQEGLLHKDTFTMNDAQYKATGKSGDIAGICVHSFPNSCVSDDYALNYSTLEPFVDKVALTNGVKSGALIITDKCKEPEIVCAFFDQFYSEEGGLDACEGLDGHGRNDQPDGSYTSNKANFGSYSEYCMIGSASTPCLFPDIRYTGNKDPLSAASFSRLLPDGYIPQKGTYLPTISFSTDESPERNDLHATINGEINNYIAEVATGIKNLEDTWDTFQKTLKDMGADRYLELYKTAYERTTQN